MNGRVDSYNRHRRQLLEQAKAIEAYYAKRAKKNRRIKKPPYLPQDQRTAGAQG